MKKRTANEQLDEAMSTMNVGAFMKVSRGVTARPRTMLDFNQWAGGDDAEEDEDFPTLRTGVWSEHGRSALAEANAGPGKCGKCGKHAKELHPDGKLCRTCFSNKMHKKLTKKEDVGRAQLESLGVGTEMHPTNGYFSPMTEGRGKAIGVRQPATTQGGPNDFGISMRDAEYMASQRYYWTGSAWTTDQKKEKRFESRKGASKDLRAAKKAAPAFLKSKGAGKSEDADEAAGRAMFEGKKKLHPSMHKHTNSPKFKAHVGDSDDSEKPYHKGKGIQKEDERVGASVLREGKKKLHPSMLKHIGSKKFKAHVGDSDDSEPPYHKGKGIQKEDERIGAGVLLREGSQSWKKLWGKAKSDLKAKGKGPASASTLARMDRKQGKAGAQPNPYRSEDPEHTAHKGRRGKKTKER